MFAARGGFLYQEATVPVTTFGNSAFWSNSTSNNSTFLSTTSTTNLINWKNTSGFTIEYWCYVPAFGGTGTINPGPGNHNNGTTNYWSFGPGPNNELQFYYWGSGQQFIRTLPNSLATNAWHNLCMVATTSGSSATVTLYIDGVRTPCQLNTSSYADSQTVVNGLISTSTAFVMGGYGSAYWKNLYMDNLRVSNINRYSGASYTLATGPFTSDADTQLLLICDGTDGSTSFTDSSSFTRTITNNSNLVTVSDAKTNHS